ncbi:MAG: hypothetical protein HYS17_06270 [Micavibrio aeruginosavorus]|uniref:Uncharacterized protein n=1 Tax=Micavibrio aeruginosavorus TaxID=349221 RepID=A0A7T5R0A6_9BACT|nr:MAG: hypothetical protein HYS17_06270 [Micavibrio aeruginosavorus]
MPFFCENRIIFSQSAPISETILGRINGNRLKKLAHPDDDSSNGLLEELEVWNAELTRLNSPSLRPVGEAKL